MSEKDRQLISDAKKLHPTSWSIAGKLAEKADSQEAKNELLSIEKSLYHKEEGNDI
jgi:hypothetical protein